MENREIVADYVRRNGSLEDRQIIKAEFMKADLDAIKETEAECIVCAETIADLKKSSLSYQWHENNLKTLMTRLENKTVNFLFKYK
jgi:hypothetical protein